MATPIVSQRSEKIREQARAGSKRYRRTAKGKAAHSRAMSKRYRILKEKGICVGCGKRESVAGHVQCQSCKNQIQANTTIWKQKMRDLGLCTRCGKFQCLPSMKGRCDSFCERCYFRKTSTDCLKTAKHAALIGQKLHDQNYRCAYTGEEIILGLNDSLDHILPISKYPELRNDPNNVEWVTRKVNCMKWDSTRDEFIATAYAVVRHYESQR